ncbi:MAG: FAD:protein FMN transferase [Ruminococcus sp.]|uniref:FAD:protein FMN transferase n=1 Tax=Ruminococcus sp. TaxID=41978 RepID=UPI001B1AF057|nr:FAD:protein FMN transferase [Ruminococcus sp.]MBO7473858.1 FAD:protein FMN transferase [Ruminococcus sp.]
MHNKLIDIAAVILGSIVLFSCSRYTAGQKIDDTVPCSRDIFAMDTYMNLKAYGANAEKALSEAEDRIISLEKELSVTSDSSEIYALNNSSGEATSLSEDAVFLIGQSKLFGRDTDGCLDITVFPILREWGFTTGNYHIPDEDIIVGLLKDTGFEKIIVNGSRVQLPDNLQIDLGAVTKGYTGDEVIEIMRSEGISSCVISLGGNVQTLGTKPDGTNWKVAVRDPYKPETDMCIVDIADKAVITSGNYERYFIGDDGKRYCHIIDPKDGYPADNGFVSVTVIGENGLTCDALSTAVFVAGEENSADIIRKYPGYDFIIVSDKEKIYYTKGLDGHFQNTSSMAAEVMKG